VISAEEFLVIAHAYGYTSAIENGVVMVKSRTTSLIVPFAFLPFVKEMTRREVEERFIFLSGRKHDDQEKPREGDPEQAIPDAFTQ
jgi:hypothetical protein